MGICLLEDSEARMPTLNKIVIGVLVAGAVLAIAMVILLAVLARVSRRTTPALGVTDGALTPCPDSPNCVCSQAEDERHAIAPIAYAGSMEEARVALLSAIAAMEGASVVTDDVAYIRVEIHVKGFGFVDDAEFVFDEEAQVIHFRSSARVPYYDYDVNRKRMEGVRAAFEVTSN